MVETICQKAKVPFVSPDQRLRQPVEGFNTDELGQLAAAASSDREQSFTRGVRSRGVLNGKGITIKGVKAKRDQLRNLEVALAQADEDGAEGRARLALVLSLIVETRAQNLPGGDQDSRGILQLQDRTQAWLASQGIRIDSRDIGQVVHGYLVHGYGAFYPRGAIRVAKDNPQWSAMEVASATNQGFISSAYVSELTKWQAEGEKIMRVWAGADEDTDLADLDARTGTPDRARIETYQFRVEGDKDYYTAAVAFADDVNWRFWVQGNDAGHPDGLAWFADDLTLARATPVMLIREGENGIDKVRWSADSTGAIDDMSVDCRAARWVGAPGQVVVVENEGDADGRWLIRSLERDYLDLSFPATVTLGRPEDPKLEPRAQIAFTSGSAPVATADNEATGTTHGRKFKQASQVARMVQKMDQIASQNLPYAWGGGHNSQFTPSPGAAHSYGGAVGVGYDCSGAVSAVLHHVGLLANPLTSGVLENWGQPGEGDWVTVWTNANHVFFIVKFPDGTKKLWEASPPDGGNWHPMRDTGGYTPRHDGQM
jgi:hypothetical protein